MARFNTKRLGPPWSGAHGGRVKILDVLSDVGECNYKIEFDRSLDMDLSGYTIRTITGGYLAPEYSNDF